MWVIFQCFQSFELRHLVIAPVRNTKILQISEHYACTFLGYCPPTLPQANINTYFSLKGKCWLREGVGG